ncbi:Txe/YoeB family addiction module toxin [Glycomyces paridis]|uniref:Endoribonuclease YoeB n=1 Tax=Glycomyces paridis TaxID=2126555 RepID=A0A4S8PE69_9ACTN|nr:Txe/YoeB family addiction module toxin [Glycomyces paridis]THV28678.1 Txe/YoeB family addiction module toxin [Glycomyces paridis]
MKTVFSEEGWEDYTSWAESDRKVVKRINRLVKEIKSEPFTGIGKPEPLKGPLSGWWSRRIDDEHRLVYRVRDDVLGIIQAHGHYGG